MESLKCFINQEDGTTAVEYAIMASAIAAVIITVVLAIGLKTESSFSNFNESLP